MSFKSQTLYNRIHSSRASSVQKEVSHFAKQHRYLLFSLQTLCRITFNEKPFCGTECPPMREELARGSGSPGGYMSCSCCLLRGGCSQTHYSISLSLIPLYLFLPLRFQAGYPSDCRCIYSVFNPYSPKERTEQPAARRERRRAREKRVLWGDARKTAAWYTRENKRASRRKDAEERDTSTTRWAGRKTRSKQTHTHTEKIKKRSRKRKNIREVWEEAVFWALAPPPPVTSPRRLKHKCVSGPDIRVPAHKMVELTLEMEDFDSEGLKGVY